MARPPPSSSQFKYVPGRHRTQKWNTAKTYSYEGDDWGGYDPYDDYGSEPQVPPPQSIPSMSRAPGPMPAQPPYGGRPRQTSFDEGEERRQFSGPAAMMYDQRGGSPARSAGSGGRPSNDYGPRPGQRIFTNPEQAPPPLNTHASPAPGPQSAPFPPRKSSMSTGSPAPEPVSAPQEKELPAPPFIRPSDIYKRIEAERERERQSMDSNSRPSLESLQRETDSPAPSSTGRSQRPLSSVDEDGQPIANVPKDFGEPRDGSYGLPAVQGVSSFGSDMFGGTPASAQPASATTTDPMQTTPIATRAPPGSDPAADILAERQPARAPPGADPAAELLAERQPARAAPGFDPAAEILSERQATQPAAATYAPPHTDPAAELLAERQPATAQPGSDPAAEILNERQATQPLPAAYAPSHTDPAAELLAERQHSVPISAIGGNRQPELLSHQPSSGYRSMVNRAFDQEEDSNVSRSNTQSSSSISPIMSRVPSAATAQMRQQERDASVPTIAEEPRSRSTSQTPYAIPRKPSPGHSRNVSEETQKNGILAGAAAVIGAGAAAVGITSGYRRSLDPPSHDNSPARTPGLEDTRSRRLSQGITAETFSAETPAVPDQGVEMQASLQPAETPASEISEPGALPESSDLPRTGRARAGTDYSLRESDMARAVNASPEKAGFSPEAAEMEKLNQNFFLQNHSNTPTSPIAPGSGRNSPSKGRVRDLAGKYQEIDEASRRNSTASSTESWANFRGSDENLPGKVPPKRHATNASNMVSESDYDAFDQEDPNISRNVSTAERPELARDQSFRPQLPGQWVSFQGSAAPTPAEEYSPVARELSVADRTPRASTGVSEFVDLTPTTTKRPLTETHGPNLFANAKDAGAALGASLTSNHGLGHTTRDFGSSEPAQPVDQPEIENKPLTGNLGYMQVAARPELNRGDTEMTNDSMLPSSASSRPPTPPAKDTPGAEREATYFNVAPLRTDRSREGSPDTGADGQTSGMTHMLSTRTGPGDMESDRLRKEIVRSLDSSQVQEDAERTQDALDAPMNEVREAEGKRTFPAAEISEPPKLGMLDKRFSWETSPGFGGTLAGSPAAQGMKTPPVVREPEPESSPEIKPEMPYERPRSRGLHIMNAADDSSEDEAIRDPKEAEKRLSLALPVGAIGTVSPITKSQENLSGRFNDGDRSRELSLPSSISEGGRIPSYYTQDSSGLEIRHPEEDTTAAAPEVDTDAAAASEAPQPISKDATSPTSSKAKIPPFREILTIKSSAARIQAYDDTRQTFADMNTGLSDWLSGMLVQHPEHANLSTSSSGLQRPILQTSVTGTKHKHSPSIAKFTKPFTTGERSTSQGNMQAPAPEAMPPRTPSKQYGGDMDKLQQQGKAMMKGATVFGGKAQAGAKGLLAKGRSRFGSKREPERGGG